MAAFLSAIGPKQTLASAPHVSASYPKRTFHRRDIKLKSM